jgi:TM2 domain-containing membrane protein YozV
MPPRGLNYFFIMINIARCISSAVFIMAAAVCAVLAGVDTLSVAPRPVPETEAAEPASAPAVSYAGAAISALIPGGGQFYHGRYLMGGVFLASEAGAAVFSAYWRDESGRRDREAGRLRDSAAAAWDRAGLSGGDSASVYRAGFYGVYADRAEFQARQAKFTAYSALAWAAGIHLYSFMDALELGGLTARGAEKRPAYAGLLAAAPFLGLGQLYNARPGKAGMMSMAQISLAVMALGEHRLMDAASGRYNQMMDSTSVQYAYRADHLSYWKSQYDRSFSRRNTYLWVSLFAYLYSIFDAVVDAHLSDYQEKIRLDPDLAVGVDGYYKTVLTLTLTLMF